MLGQVKNIDFMVCKLLTQAVHVTLDTLLAKARSFVDNCRQNPATRMSLADQVAYEPTRPGLCVHGQLRVATVEYKTFTAVLQATPGQKIETATRKPNKDSCILERSRACATCA